MRGERRDDRVGVWVRRPDKGDGFEDKIAAIGIRVRQWVTLHGFSLNVEPDLSHFSGIVPCGVSDPRYGVTSLADLGLTASMPEVDMALRAAFEPLFGATRRRSGVASTENNSPLPAQRQLFRAPPRADRSLSTRAPARAVAARLDHGRDYIRRCPMNSASTDPSRRLRTQPSTPRSSAVYFGPGAIADALHPAADDDVADHVHSKSPSLRVPAPAGRAGSQRSKARDITRPAISTRAPP